MSRPVFELQRTVSAWCAAIAVFVPLFLSMMRGVLVLARADPLWFVAFGAAVSLYASLFIAAAAWRFVFAKS